MDMNFKPMGPNLSPYGRGVIRPVEGQEDEFCGVGACGVTASFLNTALTPIRYSKAALLSTTDAGSTAITTSNQDRKAFISQVGDAGDGITTTDGDGFDTAYTISESETNYIEGENPVPVNGNWLFCAVGLTATVESTWQQTGAAGSYTARNYPAALTSAADYRETLREELINNVALSLLYGNTKQEYSLDIIKHYPASHELHGSGRVSMGAVAMPMQFNPFNAVICIDSRDSAKKVTIRLSYAIDGSSTIAATTVPLPASANLLTEVELALYGFLIQGADSIQAAAAQANCARPAQGMYR